MFLLTLKGDTLIMKTALAILLTFTLSLFADIADSINLNYQKAIIKHRSQNSKCYMFVDINGNEDWESKKDELNTIIEKSNRCRKIVIYKSIKNVNQKRDSKFDMDIGAIIEKNRHLNIQTIIVIKNTTLKGRKRDDSVDVGNRIKKSKRGAVYLRDMQIESNINIENSNLGSNSFKEMRKSIDR
jgi:hypothetical protein